MTQVKQCCKCGTLKPIEDFSKSYKHTCKECVAVMARESRAHKKEIKDMIEEIYPLLPTPDLSYKLPPIDWEQRRFEAAKAAMQGMLAADCFGKDFIIQGSYGHKAKHYDCRLIANLAIDVSDELINQLKNTPVK